MNNKSKEIILRHLKGIVHELEKELKKEGHCERFDFYENQFGLKETKKNGTRPVLK